jgi:hypothetical protein
MRERERRRREGGKGMRERERRRREGRREGGREGGRKGRRTRRGRRADPSPGSPRIHPISPHSSYPARSFLREKRESSKPFPTSRPVLSEASLPSLSPFLPLALPPPLPSSPL